MTRTPEENFLGGFLIPSLQRSAAALRRAAGCPYFSLSRPNRKPLYAVLTLLRPIPHSPVKARKKAARKPGGLHFGEIT